jgi:uncharacterized protein
MASRKTIQGRMPAVWVLLLLSAAAVRCAKGPSTIQRSLRDYIDTIKVVNAHEHQRWPPEFEGRAVNFYMQLAYSYLYSDLVSAGAPAVDFSKPDAVLQGDLEALWKKYGPALEFSRNTSFYGVFLAGFKLLYGFPDSSFTEKNIGVLSAQIAANYGHRTEWYEQAFRRAGFEIMLVDQYWNRFGTGLDNRNFALVLNIDPLVNGISERERLTAEGAPAENNIFDRSEKEGKPIHSLDDYLAAADRLFKEFQEHNVVSLKNSLAYNRSLDFNQVPADVASTFFARPSGSLSGTEKKALQDFMFHWIVRKSIALGLPIQIHTGYLYGNGSVLENGRPMKLNNLFLEYPQARFVLFHGGYPWTGEFAALGKMFPNVFLDLVWLPEISREAAVRGLDEMLDTVPYNKFFWGGDCHFIEESAGALVFAKDVVSQVLATRVGRGLLTEDLARDIARHIFRDNAIRFFKLKLKTQPAVG